MIPDWLLTVTAWLIVAVGALVIVTGLLFVAFLCFDYWFCKRRFAVEWCRFLDWRLKERRKGS